MLFLLNVPMLGRIGNRKAHFTFENLKYKPILIFSRMGFILTKSLNQQLEKRKYKREEAMNKKKKKQVKAG